MILLGKWSLETIWRCMAKAYFSSLKFNEDWITWKRPLLCWWRSPHCSLSCLNSNFVTLGKQKKYQIRNIGSEIEEYVIFKTSMLNNHISFFSIFFKDQSRGQDAHRQQDGSHARILPSAGIWKIFSCQLVGQIVCQLVGQIVYLCPFLNLLFKYTYIFMQCRSTIGGDRLKLSQWYNAVQSSQLFLIFLET